MTDHGTLTGLTDDDHPQYLLKSIVDAKGDLYVASADNVLGRLPVGTNGQILVADSAQTLGMKWAESPVSWMGNDLAPVYRPLASSVLTYVTVTANATPHTKGTPWVDLVASTPAAATMMRVKLKNSFVSGSSSGCLLDIGTGALGAETAVISNLNAGFLADSRYATEFWFPVAIPSGTRISARSQAQIASGVLDVHITLFNGTNKVATAVEALGIVSASSRGTNIISSATVNTKGSWVPLIASTANAYTGLLVAIGGGGMGTITAGGTLSGVVDIGTGASTVETVLPGFADLTLVRSTSETVAFQTVLPVMNVNLAAGTRISARWAQDRAAADTLDVAVYGLR